MAAKETAMQLFCAIELDGATLYTTQGVGTRRDIGGTLTYFPPLLQIGSMTFRFQALDVAIQLPTVVDISVDNAGDWLDQYHGFGGNTKIWDNRTVVIKAGGSDGSDWASMQTLFAGRIRRRSTKHTEQRTTFEAFDQRAEHDKNILTLMFDEATYPDAEDKARGNFLPVIYGDWTTNAGPAAINRGRLPAYCTDTEAADRPFKVASHAITDLTVYKYDGTSWATLGAGDITEDLANGGFAIKAAEGYTPGTDKIEVDCKGRAGTLYGSDPTGGTSGMFTFAADILVDLLTTYGGADLVADLDAGVGGTFSIAHDESDKYDSRNWFGGSQQTTVFGASGGVAFQNTMQLYVDSQKYVLLFDIPPVTVSASAAGRAFVKDKPPVELDDPDGVYSNQILAQAAPQFVDPDAGPYYLQSQVDSVPSQTEYGQIVSRTLVFDWLYDLTALNLQCERRLFVWSSRSHIVEFELIDANPTPTAPFFSLNLAQVVEVTHWQYNKAPCMIRQISKDAASGRVRVRGLAIQDAYQLAQWSDSDTGADVLTPARWQNDSPISHPPAGRWF
ncbi:hypothetical protein N9164_12515 [Draconibacterium sp.]|nr:hypothetical protein [Draconibacterium sp.]